MEYWPLVKDDVNKALDGTLTVDDIYQKLLKHEAQLWVVHDGEIKAIIVSEIVDYPQIRTIRALAMTGKDLEQWLDMMIETISKWGIENGAHIIEAGGRMGWKKVLEKRGFKNPKIYMTLDIQE